MSSFLNTLTSFHLPSSITSSPFYPSPLVVDPSDPRAAYLGDTPAIDAIPLILMSCVLHFLIFFLVPIPSSMVAKDRPLPRLVIRNYLVSTIHAVNASLLVMAWSYFYDRDLASHSRTLGGGHHEHGDWWGQYAVALTVGYFLHDTIMMCLFPKQLASAGALFHHIVISICMISGLVHHVGHAAHFILLLEELSTPCLNLKSLYKHHPKRRAFFEYSFVFLFFYSRFAYGLWIFVHCCFSYFPLKAAAENFGDVLSPRLAFMQLASCFLTRILNFYWGYLIIKKLFARSDNKKKLN